MSRRLALLAGTGQPALGAAVGKALGIVPTPARLARFPDGEMEILLEESVRGLDVFIVQPTCAPVGENLLELLLLADAADRSGAASVSAVVPFFGYARQDRRRKEGQPHGARVMGSTLQTARLVRVLAVDLHSAALEGCLSIPVEHLSAVPLLCEAIRAQVHGNSVVVSPDLGAVKFAEVFATRLNLPMCIIHKSRLSGSAVAVRGIVGDVRGLRPIIVDDMIATGSTISATVSALREAGCENDISVAATHGLLVGGALDAMGASGVQRLFTTDSVKPPANTPFEHHVVPLGGLLADAIRRIDERRPLNDLLASR